MSDDENLPDLDEQHLLPYKHVIKVKSKRIRNRMCEAFNHWLRIPEEKMREIDDIVSTCHEASIILDDIQDGIETRRGIPAAHCVYGVPWATNTVLYVIMLIMEKCSKLGHPEAMQVYNEQTLEMARGQFKEIYWRDKFICPTEAEYRKMTKQKTGGMINLCVRLMTLFSENKTDYSPLALKLGYFFQLVDDYWNIYQPEDLNDYYMDLTEGKFTVPLIHAARSQRGEAVTSILKQRPTDITLKRYCVSLLEELGSLEYTRTVMMDVEKDLRSEISRFGGNPMMDAVLDQLHKY
ncbi:unnamed protein product [Leptosia nina]|uniref:Geranylgeranyl pyrophosphate synthase n=1 Tax=Leptosia nina TaxID=320188 RepID=A0AAV1J210_9NEOP